MNDFSKSRRLLTKNDYTNVFQQAKKIVTPYFTVLYRNNDLEHSRLGLTISKKMISKSHDRNRVKRIIRETFRINKILPPVDIVVLAKPGLGKVENAVISDLFIQTCEKLIE